jgi:prophage antirepressor-like protein
MDKYKCDKCNRSFCSVKTLETHKNKFHCLKIDIKNAEVLDDLSTKDNHIFKFNNKPIKYFIHNDKLYFKAKDIAKILEYVNTKDAITRHVSEKDKFDVSYFKGNFARPLDEKTNLLLASEHPQTIYINESGLYALALSSQMPEAKDKFKYWVTSEVLPSIRETGEYKLSNIENVNLITYDNTIETEINDYINKDCVYILHVKDNIYKFGHSSKLDVRLNTHKNELDYKKKIKIYILDNINQTTQLEKQLKYYFRKYNMLITYENKKEIFQTDDIDSVIKQIDKFAESIQNKNKDLKYNDDSEDDIEETEKYKSQYNEELKLEFEKEKTKQIVEQEKTKQMIEKTKQLELEIEFYKIKINININ